MRIRFAAHAGIGGLLRLHMAATSSLLHFSLVMAWARLPMKKSLERALDRQGIVVPPNRDGLRRTR
jgi:hypothetical protein